ncbi:mechanosensitive ion channel family protein [Sinorhizobium meliloti]|uniref:mechanosensitive ion channel family protein n=1 Tax=Rhizobium meliloti TaxID=382 RepID=UPI000FD48C1E|nr:mechanosensitive ion channel family protein [Sinorhizobium meliloti]MDE3786748.1 mechanosensitive ion channel family protein [Sinorhizobium meliloti]RVI10998.1 mechanosensitive ion channel family protein [Sinorhizobium meliloti]
MFGDDNSVPLVLVNVLGVAGIVVWYIQGGTRPTGRLIAQILFFSVMSVVLYLGGIAPYRPDAVHLQGIGALLSKSARILWWAHLAWAVIGFIQIYVRLNRRPREAHLIQDMAIAAIYLGVALSVVGFVFGMPVGTLVTTSGVIAVIFGLALQNTLGDVFSGIALTLGRAYAIGDWIELTDGTEGRVIETNWRSTNLLSATHNVVVLPNSVLAKQGMTNLSRPDETHLITLRVRVAATQRPRVVEEIMRSALQSSVLINKSPPPVAALKAIDAIAIEVELQFRVDNVAIRTPAKNEIVDLLHDRCEANGLSLAIPAESLAFMPPPTDSQYLATLSSRPVRVTAS